MIRRTKIFFKWEEFIIKMNLGNIVQDLVRSIVNFDISRQHLRLSLVRAGDSSLNQLRIEITK